MPSPEDLVSRFIVDKREVDLKIPSIKRAALKPSRRDNSTSVFCIGDLSENSIWDLGDQFVAPTRGAPFARADLTPVSIRSVGLALVVDNTPPRHASITGWPSGKDEWMSIAQELAALATARIRPKHAA